MTIMYIALIMLVNAFLPFINWNENNRLKRFSLFSVYVIFLFGAIALCCLALSSAFQNNLHPTHYIVFAIIIELGVFDFTSNLCRFLKE